MVCVHDKPKSYWKNGKTLTKNIYLMTTEKNVGKWKKLDFISYSSSAMAVGKQKKTFDLFHVHTYNMHIIMSREFCYHLATII